MHFRGAKFMIVLGVHLLVDDEVIEDMLEVLEVGHITTRTHDGVVADGV